MLSDYIIALVLFIPFWFITNVFHELVHYVVCRALGYRASIHFEFEKFYVRIEDINNDIDLAMICLSPLLITLLYLILAENIPSEIGGLSLEWLSLLLFANGIGNLAGMVSDFKLTFTIMRRYMKWVLNWLK